jgi:pyridoxamine 5'-phosphate oxidase
MELSGLRKSYLRSALERTQLEPDPIAQFERWFAEALAAGLEEPSAMALATADADGRPSVRMVLLKGVSQAGFVFYTNYQSRKARELAVNPFAALCFYWEALERQVRVEGEAEKLPEEVSDAYFQSRPRGSQLGAWASPQSQTIASRAELEARLKALEAEYAERPVPRPPFWGGYLLRPTALEFWQGRENRLHDRFRYTQGASGWHLERLAP